MSSDEELYTGIEDLTILVDDDKATSLNIDSVGKVMTKSITKKIVAEGGKRTYPDNAFNRQLSRVGLPVGTAKVSDLIDNKDQKVYVDNAENRRLGRVGLPWRSVVTNNDDAERAFDDKNDPRVYVDNAQNRRLGRVGLPFGSAVTKNYDAERTFNYKKDLHVYAENALNRRLGIVGLPMGLAVKENYDTKRALDDKKDPRVYFDNSQSRRLGRVDLSMGTAVTENYETERALDDKKDPRVYTDNPLNRKLGRIGMPMRKRKKVVRKNDDGERDFYVRTFPKVYTNTAQNRGQYGLTDGAECAKNDAFSAGEDLIKNDDTESIFNDNNDLRVYTVHAEDLNLGYSAGPERYKAIEDIEKRNFGFRQSEHICSGEYADINVNSKLDDDGLHHSEQRTISRSKSGSDVAGENVDTELVCFEMPTGRMQIHLNSLKDLWSDIKTISPNQSFSDNDSYWCKCLAQHDQRYAYKALRRNEIPDQDELNELAQNFGRKSKVISAICDKIASYIKAKDECIVDVWAAYNVDCNNIVFVIIVDKNVNFGKNVEYSFVKKLKGDVSYEGEDVINKSSVEDMSSANKELLRKSINLNNVDLMKKHKYLMMISGSPVRSKGFNNQSHTVTSETCIVLYVLVKGFIPIQEDPFEKQYNGVAVDVREGFFQLFTGAANTYHEHLKNGCQIHREQLGTLGGFVDYQGFGTCGITCAHVLLNPRDMKYLAPTTENLMDCGFSASGQTVYQPDNTQEHHAIGKVLKAIYKKGGGGESGMDVALVKIYQRYPQFGDFPNLEDGNPSNIQFDSGKTAHYAGIQSGDVLKFGATTGLTYGSMVMDTSTLSVRTYQPFTYNEEYEIILHNLLEIRTTIGHPAFAEPGDSGALVFCTGENNELCCVGVVEGGTKHKTCVVMPITPILQQLNFVSLKCFERNRMLEHFERKIGESFAQLKNEITKEINQTNNTINSAYSSLETRISQNEQNTQTAFATILQKLNQLDQKMQNNQNNNH